MKARDYKDATDLIVVHGTQDPETETILPVTAVSYGIRTANTSSNGWGIQVEQTHTLTAEGFDASEDGTGRGTPVIAFNPNQVTSPTNRSRVEPGAPCPTLTKFGEATCVAFHSNAQADQWPTSSRDTSVSDALTCSQRAAVAYSTKLHNTGANNAGKLFEEYSTCLDANSPSPALLTPSQVRRLTPIECERLQGFPDNHTRIPWRGKPAEQCPDGPVTKPSATRWLCL